MRHRYVARILAATLVAAVFLPGPGDRGIAEPMPRPDITKMDYTPTGLYKPGDAIPSPSSPPTKANPSGKWVAYDTNVYESLNFPQRQPGDTTRDDPRGTGDPRHGFCPPNDPQHTPWGKCANHQLEWLDHFERAMTEILGDFGVVIHRYPLHVDQGGPRGALLSTAGGSGWNISATVPGADHPDESVLVSGHYDMTDSGPAAAWDSAEGHTIVIRVAKIMADYWRATGTRPSATVKFIPWDGEESGTIGSAHYVANNIPPGAEQKVRAYFNMDPCAGAYPAYKNGNPAMRVPEVLQLSDPAIYAGLPAIQRRVTAFNKRAETVVDEVFEHLDDTLEVAPGVREPIFVSDREAAEEGVDSQRDEIVTALGGLRLFTSDYQNFIRIGVPIFNLFPDYFGPHADLTPASAEGIGILHTPRDNLTTINALTSRDQSGLTASEGWAKGMEMCAHIEGWYMLQPEMGGAQTSTTDPVAYFEALPNEAFRRAPVVFDATGSYQYAEPRVRVPVADGALEYRWDFGDGTSATGKVVRHAYAQTGHYTSMLTVTNRSTGESDTMRLPITVVPSLFPGPELASIPRTDADGRVKLAWSFEGEQENFKHFVVERSDDLRVLLSDDAEGDLEKLWVAGDTDWACAKVVGNETARPCPAVHKWQRSDSSQPKTLGNKHHSGESGYWTGGFPTVVPVGTNQQSTLTLAKPVHVPIRDEVRLTYWSLFASELDDVGRVEVALDDGKPATSPRQWIPVDTVSGSFAPDEPDALTEELHLRKVSLNEYKGRDVFLRFTWVLGDSEGNRVQPAGWYIDDIRLEAASWAPIGTATQKQFTTPGTPKGTYAYRVFGVYRGNVETSASNAEVTRVTEGTRDAEVLGGSRGRGGVLPKTGLGAGLALGAILLALGAMLRRWAYAGR